MGWRQRLAGVSVVALAVIVLPMAGGEASTSDKAEPVELSAEEVWASTGGRYGDEYGRILEALGTPVSTNGVIENAQGSTVYSAIFQVENEERVIIHLPRGRDSVDDRLAIEAMVAAVAPGFVVEFSASMEYSEADLIALAERIGAERTALRDEGVLVQGAIANTDRQVVMVPVDDGMDRTIAQRTLTARFGSAVEVIGSYRTNGRAYVPMWKVTERTGAVLRTS